MHPLFCFSKTLQKTFAPALGYRMASILETRAIAPLNNAYVYRKTLSEDQVFWRLDYIGLWLCSLRSWTVCLCVWSMCADEESELRRKQAASVILRALRRVQTARHLALPAGDREDDCDAAGARGERATLGIEGRGQQREHQLDLQPARDLSGEGNGGAGAVDCAHGHGEEGVDDVDGVVASSGEGGVSIGLEDGVQVVGRGLEHVTDASGNGAVASSRARAMRSAPPSHLCPMTPGFAFFGDLVTARNRDVIAQAQNDESVAMLYHQIQSQWEGLDDAERARFQEKGVWIRSCKNCEPFIFRVNGSTNHQSIHRFIYPSFHLCIQLSIYV